MQLNFTSFKEFCEYFSIEDVLNKETFKEAITHPSFSKKKNYERMEFLGDTILNFCISRAVFEKFLNKDEGFLSKKKSFLCSRKICGEICKKIKLSEKIIISKHSNVMIDTIAGNVFESFLCCIYYEYGIEKVHQIVEELFEEYINIDILNPKMYLQEYMQKKYKTLPEYTVISKEGAENSPIFKVLVRCGKNEVEGIGKSKKDAEINGATNMLNLIFNNKNRKK